MPLRRSTPPVAAPCTAGAIHTGKATREWKCGTRGLGGGEPGPVPRICKFLGRLSSFCHARVQCSYTVIGVHAFRKLCYLSNEDAGTRIRGVPPRVPPGPGPGARRRRPRSSSSQRRTLQLRRASGSGGVWCGCTRRPARSARCLQRSAHCRAHCQAHGAPAEAATHTRHGSILHGWMVVAH